MSGHFFEIKDVWSPDDIYSNHRIPGMLVTGKGTLLIYCEARRTPGDWAMMDILLQCSHDHGESFSSPIVLARGTDKHKTVNNPVMMQDKNGRIHFLYCEDYTICGGRVIRRYSDDDGQSWSDPIDITAMTLPDHHNAFALGPGHGITLNDGTLLVPVWMVPKQAKAPIQAHSPSVVTTLYSKDNGETWALGELLGDTEGIKNPNETQAVVTSDGRVYINLRMQQKCRAKAYSKNGYSDWTDYGADEALPDPQCFGSVAVYNDGVNPYTLLFVNCASTEKRIGVTVRASYDDGKSFQYSRLIDGDRGGYCEIAVDNKSGIIYVLYENEWGVTDHLARFNYEWIVESK
jgi:sialidase-1